MSQRIEPLEYGKYYHIYNRAVGKDNLFGYHANYEHFLRLYDKYIEPVAETFAWCLMPNHLHLLIRMKTLEEILEANKPVRFTKPKRPHQYFSISSTPITKPSISGTIVTEACFAGLLKGSASPTKNISAIWCGTYATKR